MEKARAILRASRHVRPQALPPFLRRGSPGGREVLQLGGDDPDAVGAAAALALDFDYSEINLCSGCPAVETGGGDFGASLMRDPHAPPPSSPPSTASRTRAAFQSPSSAASASPRLRMDVVLEGATPDEIEAALAAPLRSFVLACVDAGARGVVLHCREA